MKNCGQEVANKKKKQKSDSFRPLKSKNFEEIIPKVNTVEIFPVCTQM